MAKRKKRVKRKARRPRTLTGAVKKSIGKAERKVTKSIRHIKKHL